MQIKIMLKSNHKLICYFNLFNNVFKRCLLLLFLVFIVFTQIKCEPHLHEQLNYYEVISVSDIKHHKIAKRSAETILDDLSNESVEHLLSFRAIERNFDLRLTQNKALISPKFNAFTVDSKGRKRAVRADLNHHYSGTVDGIEGSRVTAHIDPSSGLMTAYIHTVEEIYEVEPIWRHSDSHKNNKSSMIVFRHSDVQTHKHSNNTTKESKHFCDFVKIDGNATDDDMETNHWVRRKREAFIGSLNDNSDDFSPAATQCTLVLVADYLFFQTMGNSDTPTTMNYMIHIIDRVNNIFNNTEWSVDKDRPGFKGMGFFVKEVQIHEEPTVDDPEHYNYIDLAGISPNELLELFSLSKENRQFCLAHLFTHRTFSNSVLGLAYVSSHRIGSVGGICSSSFQKRDKQGNVRDLYLNTGLTTTRNLIGQRIITREAVLVTAHELGHNWGSEHDPHTEECSPSAKNGGSYIMYTYSVTGLDDNNRFFSPCSKRSIRKVLVHKSAKCFIKPERSYCGNSIVEEGEDCDEGLLVKGEGYERGLCCDNRCRFIAGSDCSDKNHECCSSCRIKRAGIICKRRDDFNCRNESVCDGESATCPEPTALMDGVECLDRGLCKAGKCMSFCSSIQQETCMCEEPEFACYRCCQRHKSAQCLPIYPRDPLPDGTPCRYGFCEKQRCEKRVQDFVERFWDVIEDININTFIIFMKDNIVGVVIIVSLIIWIPISFAISYYDKKQAEERKRRRSASLQSDMSRRRIRRQFSRRPTRPGLVTNGITVSNQSYYPF